EIFSGSHHCLVKFGLDTDAIPTCTSENAIVLGREDEDGVCEFTQLWMPNRQQRHCERSRQFGRGSRSLVNERLNTVALEQGYSVGSARKTARNRQWRPFRVRLVFCETKSIFVWSP